MAERHDVTELLQAHAAGRPGALQGLIDVVYDELCRVAHRQMRGERAGHTLDTRALVNEAYLHLARLDRFGWKDRGHFFGIAGRAMKQILIQHARARVAKKRGEGARATPLDEVELLSRPQAEGLLAVEQLLGQLDGLGERYRSVVELKVFSGLTVDEIGEALGVSRATVKRDWTFARAWLNQALAAPSSVAP